ncbi:MAG: MFS transporter [Candidatus Rickettsiella isopodorum]|jgi:MFS transporter, DHA1 family, tetracycline resistance protein|nr:MFS transporter [Candidatus Rickettsiella isopodorum]
MPTKRSSNGLTISVIALCLIMFIDGIGMSLVLPLIGALFSSDAQSIITSSTSNLVYQFYYAGSLVCFSGAMIIGATFLGQLSDYMGRKVTLQLSLIGTVIGYLICAFAVIVKFPLLFLIGRIIDGLTAGSIPVAQAMLIDRDSRQNKMTSIGLVMFAVTSGYMFGPVISSIVFNYQSLTHALYLPFLWVAILSMICLGLLSYIKESSIKNTTLNLDLMLTFRQIKALLREQTIFHGLCGFFLFQCAWVLFYQYLPRMTLYMPSLSSAKIGLLLTEVGIGMCVAFCLVVPKVQTYLSPKQLIISCVGLFTLSGFSFLAFNESWVQLQLISLIMAVLYAVGYSAMLAYLLSIADDRQKGLILGSLASICAISAMFTALLGSTLMSISYLAFFQVISFASLIALLLFLKKKRVALSTTA